jgi:two-component system response regulator YesN
MLKAFVVDDEKLVRKGFISLIDWSSFGIEIVGEAADGKSALAALQTQQIDLLFTDITMPNMSGFELIREVQKLKPRVYTVVLTCHHDFDYLQEAMRLGAIDYFVKTLLDMDNIDVIMNRIVSVITEGRSKYAAVYVDKTSILHSYGAGLYYFPLKAGMQLEASQLLKPGSHGPNLHTEGGGWLLPMKADWNASDWEREWNRAPIAQWLPIYVSDLSLWSSEQDWVYTIPLRLQQIVFYRYAPDTMMGLLKVSGSEIKRLHNFADDQNESLDQHWYQYQWLYLRKEWEKLIELIESAHPAAKQLNRLAENLIEDIEPMMSELPAFQKMKKSVLTNYFWTDWQRWLQDFTQLIWQLTFDRSFSPDVVISLPRAIRYMKQNLGREINQHEVAAYVNMSRSYFSRYFKSLIGEPFGDFLRSLRFAYAIELLEQSELPIYVIAEKSGFLDDKYFSRVFRERTGSLPTEYRSAHNLLN